MITAIRQWLFLFLFAERCFMCGRRGFLHSWITWDTMRQWKEVVWGNHPENGHCSYCGKDAYPVLAPMEDGRKGWVMGWWTTEKP